MPGLHAKIVTQLIVNEGKKSIKSARTEKGKNVMRKLVMLLSFASLVLLCVVTISCGGSSSSTSTSCSGPAVDVVGDWMLNLTGSGGSASGPGVINSSGLAVFFQTGGSTPGDTVVMPAITGGEKCFSGTVTAYGTPATGGGAASQSVQGTINSSSSITGSLSNGENLSLASSSPFTGPVTALSGSGWDGEIEGYTGLDNSFRMTFAPTGTNANMNFSGSSNLCDINGTFTQETENSSGVNVFDVSITYSQGIGCPANVTGIGFESSADYFNMNGGAAGTYFYAASSSSASVLEIFKAP